MTAPSHERNDVAGIAHGVVTGAASAVQLHEALIGATIYCERADTPGFLAWGDGGHGLVPAFTSPAQLALARGDVPYFAVLGVDLLNLLPEGYDLLLDIAGDVPLRLSMDAVGRVATVEVEGGLQR